MYVPECVEPKKIWRAAWYARYEERLWNVFYQTVLELFIWGFKSKTRVPSYMLQYCFRQLHKTVHFYRWPFSFFLITLTFITFLCSQCIFTHFFFFSCSFVSQSAQTGLQPILMFRLPTDINQISGIISSSSANLVLTILARCVCIQRWWNTFFSSSNM